MRTPHVTGLVIKDDSGKENESQTNNEDRWTGSFKFLK